MEEKKQRTALQQTYINYIDWARDNNIYQKILPLNPGIYGFVYLSSFQNYYVIINSNITLELQKEVFCHEVEHIMYDMPEMGYVIRIDMQYSKIERQADLFAKETAANFFT